ncbi:MAG: hypothetical protein ABIP06_11035 [Pyrinomonadaceae bacterium]
MNDHQHLAEAVTRLCSELSALRAIIGLVCHPGTARPATKKDLDCMEERIMEAVQAFSTRVKASFEKIGKAVDGVSSDVDQLKAKIEELQNTPNGWTPADQTALDEIEALVGGASTKLDALDAATEPAVVPTPTP